MKYKNIELTVMLETLKPLLKLRNKIGYVAARNTRTIVNNLTEYYTFRNSLIEKYGEHDTDNGTISINVNNPNFKDFSKELETFNNIEHDIDIMTITYDEAIGELTGEEILDVEWMLTE